MPKTIEVSEDKKIILDIDGELKMKQFRKIYPLTKEYADNEIEMVVQIIKALSSQDDVEEIIDSMNMDEMTILSEEIESLMDVKKK